MSPGGEFWWNWGVNVAVALATLAAAFVALFGDWLRAKMFRPSLDVRLANPEGELTTMPLDSPDGTSRSVCARFYHLRVSNQKRWPPATRTQVYLVRIEGFGLDNEPKVLWDGEVPLRWALQEVNPIARTIGHPAKADLCCVVQGKWAEITSLITPNNIIHLMRRRQSFKAIVSVQAKSLEAESTVLRLLMCWDGEWHDGAREMQDHFVVKPYVEGDNAQHIRVP